MDQVISIIENLDIPEDQVMIEARIVETTKNWSRSLGFDWTMEGVADAAHGNTTGLVFPNNISGAADAPTATGGASLLTGGANGFLNIGLGNILNTFELDVDAAGGGERGPGQRHLGAQGRHPEQRAGVDPERSPDPGADRRQQHGHRAVRQRHAAARRDAAHHRRGHRPARDRHPEARAAAGPRHRRRSVAADRDPRRPHARPGSRRRHRGHRRHLRGVDTTTHRTVSPGSPTSRSWGTCSGTRAGRTPTKSCSSSSLPGSSTCRSEKQEHETGCKNRSRSRPTAVGAGVRLASRADRRRRSAAVGERLRWAAERHGCECPAQRRPGGDYVRSPFPASSETSTALRAT